MPFPNFTGKFPTFTISGTKYNSAGPIIRINPTRQAFINVSIMGLEHDSVWRERGEMKSWYTNKNNGNNGGFNSQPQLR